MCRNNDSNDSQRMFKLIHNCTHLTRQQSNAEKWGYIYLTSEHTTPNHSQFHILPWIMSGTFLFFPVQFSASKDPIQLACEMSTQTFSLSHPSLNS